MTSYRRWLIFLWFILTVGISFSQSKYYGEALCAYPDFKCIKVKPRDSWSKLFPNKQDREIVKRLNRINMPIRHRPWIVVPRDLSTINYRNLSPFPEFMPTDGEKLMLINLKQHAFGAYDAEGKLLHWGPVSAGKEWCTDTQSPCGTAIGEFTLYHKKGPECVSKTFPLNTLGGAPMPHCMFFYRGFALHGSSLPGHHASHGCVRLFFEDAEWLNTVFMENGTTVAIVAEQKQDPLISTLY